MQLTYFITIKNEQNVLRQRRRVIIKNNPSLRNADNARAVFLDQFHGMQVYHHADALLTHFS